MNFEAVGRLIAERGVAAFGVTIGDGVADFERGLGQASMLTQLDLALRLGQAKQNDFAILVITLDEAAGEYITSDNPVVIWNLDRHNVAFNPDATLKLPLGPKHMLNLTPTTVDMLKNQITRWHWSGDQANLERISANIIQHNNSERWIIGSEAGVQQQVSERVALQDDLDNPGVNTAKQDIATRTKRLGFL